MNQLIKQESMPVDRQQATVADMLQMVVERGLTADIAAAFKELVQLHREEVKLNAEKEFAVEFIKLQQDIPQIVGFRPVPDRQGNVKYKYANFDDIDAIVRPICLRHGFSYAFREGSIENNRIMVIMTLQHSGGHSREIPYSVRVGTGPPGATESQADVSGHTYAQRGALESGLALRIVGDRADARMEGGPISAEDALELKERLLGVDGDEAAFLKFARSSSFETIPQAVLPILQDFILKKERIKIKRMEGGAA